MRRNIPLIVVLVNEAAMPEELPAHIARLRRHPRVEIGGNPRFKSDMRLLIKMVEERLPWSPYRTLRNLIRRAQPVATFIGWAFLFFALVLVPVLLIINVMPESPDEARDRVIKLRTNPKLGDPSSSNKF